MAQIPGTTVSRDILEAVIDAGSFQTLVRGLKISSLDEVLNNGGSYTLFAPADPAFEELTRGSLRELLNNREELIPLLSYHIVPGRFASGDLRKERSLLTLLGQEIRIDSFRTLMINSARVVKPDIECSNGIVHAIDSVLLPQ